MVFRACSCPIYHLTLIIFCTYIILLRIFTLCSLEQFIEYRTINISVKSVDVTESWWGDYNYSVSNIVKKERELDKRLVALKDDATEIYQNYALGSLYPED